MSLAEFTIVGAGLAGTTLAWALVRCGRTVRLIDREPPVTASRIAAGLLTPITGKKLSASWRWQELRPAAERFYRSVEADTGATFFHPRPILRLFTSDAERKQFEDKRATFGELATAIDSPPEHVAMPFGGFAMPTAAQLDVRSYLDTSREWFRGRGLYTNGDYPGLPRASGERESTALAAGSRLTVCCTGYPPLPPFDGVRFRPAKGEILTVRIPGLNETRVLNRSGFWVAPTSAPEVYRAGATYSWHELDCVPTAAGRAELEASLREVIRLPFEVIGHDAAVRPIVEGRRPRIGLHPQDSSVGFFNGLSSKGSLTASFFAEQFAAYLCGQGDIEPEVDVRAVM
jgi:glycine oxidase